MRSDFKAKLIAHMLNKKGSEKGFTLIELLVVIIIIGILAAIALPSFLNQANKARQSEARNYVGSINRAQQAYYLEKQSFAPNLITASIGIPAVTPNYVYGINRSADKGATGQFAFAFGLPAGTQTSATSIITTTTVDTGTGSVGAPVKAYVGQVNVSTPVNSTDALTLAQLCEQNTAGINLGAAGSPLVNFLDATGQIAMTTSVTVAPTCKNPTSTGSDGFSPLS
jgi:type IV pilus assembly protein PilA